MKRLASVALIAVAAAMVLASDLLIRARGLDGTHGLNAWSYDIVGTVLVLIGTVTFVRGGRD